jgi:hypothetical protein
MRRSTSNANAALLPELATVALHAHDFVPGESSASGRELFACEASGGTDQRIFTLNDRRLFLLGGHMATTE